MRCGRKPRPLLPQGGYGAGALALALLFALCGAARAIKKPSQLPPAVTSDIKYIRCDVCKLMAKHAFKKVQTMRKEAKGKKLAEMDIIEAMEKLTNPLLAEGQWIASIDLQEKGERLELVDMGQVGECARECKTVAKAAEAILGEHDTDLAEVLLKGQKKRAELTNWLCYELSDACAKKAPPLPAGREKGPGFVPVPAEEVKVLNMMGEMRAKGMRGKLVKPDDVLARGGRMDDDEDYDEDDDGMFGMMNGGFPGMMGGGGGGGGAGGFNLDDLDAAGLGPSGLGDWGEDGGEGQRAEL